MSSAFCSTHPPPGPCLEYQTPDNSHWVWCKEHGKDFDWLHTGLGCQHHNQEFRKQYAHHSGIQKTWPIQAHNEITAENAWKIIIILRRSDVPVRLLIFTSCSYTDSNHGPHYVHIRTCMRSVSRTFPLRSIACSLFSSRSISLYHRSSSIPSSRYIPGSFLSLLHRALLFAPWSKSHAFPHVCLMLTLYLAHALRALVC